jgi:hypothetical protein
MAAIDSSLHQILDAVVSMAVSMVVKLGGPVLFSPIFLLPGLLIGVLGAYIGNLYVKAQMSVSREMRCVSLSPSACLLAEIKLAMLVRLCWPTSGLLLPV